MAIYSSDTKGLDENAIALAKLILGDKQKADATARNQAAAEDLARRQGLKPGKYSISASDSGMSINPEDPLKNFLLPLTPAQEAAEKTAGKQIADWDAAGGRPAMQKNLDSLSGVEEDLSTNKRDAWDRGVGALLSGFPGLMGLVGSTEKARRDKARNTALTIARSTDPNPTEKQIEAIMGQIYDPASSNEDNLSRIQRFKLEQQQKANQMEQASQNYRKSGYATIGNAKPASAQKTISKKLYSPSRNKTKVVYSDGSEEILDGQQ
jgi:hypothetical protein